jgi:hypothetical protein
LIFNIETVSLFGIGLWGEKYDVLLFVFL